MRTVGLICAAVLAMAGCAQRRDGEIALANPGLEAAPQTAGEIEGWQLSQHSGPPSYQFEIDRNEHAEGAASLRIRRTREQVYGMVAQTVPISAFAGRTIELSAQMKTEDVGRGGWQLSLTFAGGGPNPRRESTPLTGTQGFRKVTISAQVPPGAAEAEIGAILLDRGTVWLDDVRLRVVQP